MLKISALFLKKTCGMLLIKTLKSKISDFLNSNMCFCSRLNSRPNSSFLEKMPQIELLNVSVILSYKSCFAITLMECPKT